MKILYNSIRKHIVRGNDMPTLKLLKAPGYIYDLLYIFFFHFNKEQYVKLFSTTEEERSWGEKGVRFTYNVGTDKLSVSHNYEALLTREK